MNKFYVIALFLLQNTFEKDQKRGACPQILNKGWHQYHGENKVLNHTKLNGDWKRIYDSNENQEECTKMKFKDVSAEELYDRGIDADKFRTKKVVQFDDHKDSKVLVFDGSIAQIDTIHNLNKGTIIGSENIALNQQSLEYLEEIELNVPPEMSAKELELSTPEYIESYNAHRLLMQETRDDLYKELSTIQARFDEASAAGHTLHVLDTDYESYLMMFMCKEHEKYADQEGKGFIEVQTGLYLKEIELNQKKNRISLAQECLKEFAALSSYGELQSLFKLEEPSFYDEIEVFMSMDHGHKDHFQYGNEPSLLEWTEIRQFYSDDFDHLAALDDIDSELKYVETQLQQEDVHNNPDFSLQIFHEYEVVMASRRPEAISQKYFIALESILKSFLPDYDLDKSHEKKKCLQEERAQEKDDL